MNKFHFSPLYPVILLMKIKFCQYRQPGGSIFQTKLQVIKIADGRRKRALSSLRISEKKQVEVSLY